MYFESSQIPKDLKRRLSTIFRGVKTYDKATVILLLEEVRNIRNIYLQHREELGKVDTYRMSENEAYATIQTFAVGILRKHLDTALEINEEFNYPPFLEGLDEVINNPNLYNIVPEFGTGKAKITLRMNEVAGDLNEYAEAVEAARIIMQIGIMPTERGSATRRQADAGGATASTFWRDKIYLPARGGGSDSISREGTKKDVSSRYADAYDVTIFNRIMSFTHPAPYWEIIDQGSIPFSDDVGGVPYPLNHRTNFVLKARLEMGRKYKDIVVQTHNKIKKDSDKLLVDYNKFIQALDKLIILLVKTLEILNKPVRIRTMSGRKTPLPKPEVAPADKVFQIQQQILRVLSVEQLMVTDQNKLSYWANQLASGGEIPTEKVGLGPGVRVRIRRFIPRD